VKLRVPRPILRRQYLVSCDLLYGWLWDIWLRFRIEIGRILVRTVCRAVLHPIRVQQARAHLAGIRLVVATLLRGPRIVVDVPLTNRVRTVFLHMSMVPRMLVPVSDALFLVHAIVLRMVIFHLPMVEVLLRTPLVLVGPGLIACVFGGTVELASGSPILVTLVLDCRVLRRVIVVCLVRPA
jgi:hypothetical protein